MTVWSDFQNPELLSFSNTRGGMKEENRREEEKESYINPEDQTTHEIDMFFILFGPGLCLTFNYLFTT